MNKPPPGPHGSFRCGCTIGNSHGYIDIVRCGLHEAAPDLLSALKDALAAMKTEVENRDGEDVFDLGCGNCAAGTPTPHSLGCRMRNAIRKAEGKS